MGQVYRVRINNASFDEETHLIIASVTFLEKKENRRFCWPADDLKQAFGIKGDIQPHHWIDFCKNWSGKEINMECEFVGDPEAPIATYEQMKSIQDNMGHYYYPFGRKNE